MTTTMTGRCMCGAIGFEARPSALEVHACHCEMCRRWTGSALLSVPVAPGDVRWSGEENLRTIASSDWAERGWCGACGTPLFYRITLEGPGRGHLSISLGTFDDPDAFAFTEEIYHDRKPASYAYAGDRKRLTKAETEARFSDAGE
jgi:hypothetical protein